MVCEVCTEVSETTKVCTEVYELDKRHKCVDEQAHHCEVQRIQKRNYVDPAGIGRKLFTLPGEISYAMSSTKEKSAEVIVVDGKRARQKAERSHTNHEGLNINWFQML